MHVRNFSFRFVAEIEMIPNGHHVCQDIALFILIYQKNAEPLGISYIAHTNICRLCKDNTLPK